jgi:hypothetical protein
MRSASDVELTKVEPKLGAAFTVGSMNCGIDPISFIFINYFAPDRLSWHPTLLISYPG